MSFGWGVAATGRIARAVGMVVAEHPEMHVAAVGSRDAGRAAALAADLGAPRSYGSYEELARDDDVAAVYVATPHAQHADVVVAALEAGKAVLCEKPLTHDLAETERLARVAQETGAFLMEGMWMRFNPLVRRVADLAESGDLGELRSLHASIGFPAPYDPGGRLWSPSLGGGALLDVGVYTVDLARLLLGDPADVRATGSLAATGVDAESSLVLTFAGGAHAVLDQSLLTRMPTTSLLVGSAGWAQLDAAFYAPTRLVVQRGDDEPEVHVLPDRRAGFEGELEEVVRCVREGRPESDVLPLAETVATMRVLDEARRQLGAA
ncbi:MAG TPA: Gfo/Idh/MocA family oxidoreductase [Mycobacteriales bacterium]|nr:Gfo/Idh/MocA family oxidoreductase [Mycobacteriales bacterium]